MRSLIFQNLNNSELFEIHENLLLKVEQVVPVSRHALQLTEEKGIVSLTSTEQAHYASMLESLSIAEWSDRHLGKCTMSCSYSMGLFSALIHAGAIKLENTFELVRAICLQAHQLTKDVAWSTGVVIQFPEEKLKNIIEEISDDLEISDYFDANTILFTGPAEYVKKVLDLTLEQGAALTRLIPLSAPFHTSHLASIESKITSLLQNVTISEPRWPILSSLSQRELLNSEDIATEITHNIFRPMNWHSTMQVLLHHHDLNTMECGATQVLSDTLRAIAPSNWLCRDLTTLSA